MRRSYSAAAIPLAALLVIVGVTAAVSSSSDTSEHPTRRTLGNASDERNKRCASQNTYAAIQRELFRQAAETRGSDEAAFGQISNYSIVRMEQPVVRSFDEELSTLRCSGKLILQLPRGIAVVGGRHALAAEVDYVLQPAADGTGDVVMLEGQAPITIPLATLARSGSYSDLGAVDPASSPVAPAGRPLAPTPAISPAVPLPTAAAKRRLAEPVSPPRTAAVLSKSKPAAPESASGLAKPSFNCRYARTRGELSVCGDAGLASLDRRMASSYYRAVSSANSSQREALRTSRNAFLRKRDRCTSTSCVSASYEERIGEIGEIMTR
jgi:uncharacterized protein YecT (DUF1311 family)